MIKGITFIPDKVIEGKANKMLAGFESKFGKILHPPIPIDSIVERHLELFFDWDKIEDTEEEHILSCLIPGSKKIIMNEFHRDFFDEHWGTEAFTKAHEVGHWDMHVIKGEGAIQVGLPGFLDERQDLCRQQSSNPREIQANMYAAYLLMPYTLLVQEINGNELDNWPIIYDLKNRFDVSITAMTKRLVNLRLVYISDDGKVFRSLEEGRGNLCLL